MTLFARTSRRVEVTASGQAFLVGARACLDAADRAATDAAAAAGLVRGTLTVGLIPTVTALDLPALLGSFHQAHPDVRIAVRGGVSTGFVTRIIDGTMDVAVLGLSEATPPLGVQSRVLAREKHVLLVAERHRLAGRHDVRLVDLAAETFADFAAGSSGRAQTDAAFAAQGVARDVAFEVAGVDLMLGLVRRGLAVALLTPGAIGDVPGVSAVPMIDGPGRVEYLAWSDFNPSPAAMAFVRSVLDDVAWRGSVDRTGTRGVLHAGAVREVLAHGSDAKVSR
ncbi:LysR substrate-binding domain-containing protein [Propionibacteriaceae bacterium G57]|uniref:LysR substrate-binding domain-containing protein n=1 Tax=Aestuariimicrobium sp. G57 TaxID=3418485 RepID=UPI003DA76E36